eukprot:Awhi_evm1s371
MPTLAIKVNNPSILAGEVITGNIVLTSEETFTAGDVNITLKGRESVAFSHKGVVGDNDKVKTVDFLNKSLTVLSGVSVKPNNNQVDKGTYVFNFVFPVPSVLPGSFASDGKLDGHPNSHHKSSIAYFFEASLMNSKNKVEVLSEKYSITIFEKISMDYLKENLIGKYTEKEAEVTGSITLYQGGFLIPNPNQDIQNQQQGLAINNAANPMTILSPAVENTFSIELNNTSIKPIPKLEVRLVEKNVVETGTLVKKTEHNEKIIIQRTINEGIPPMFYGKHHMAFTIPEGLPPTSSGFEGYKHIYELQVLDPSEAQRPFKMSLEIPVVVQQPIVRHCNAPLYPYPPVESYRPVFTEDCEMLFCTECTKEFGLLRRKHHCRQCLGIYCSKCCANEKDLKTLGFDTLQKVCNSCNGIELNPEISVAPAPLREQSLTKKDTLFHWSGFKTMAQPC